MTTASTSRTTSYSASARSCPGLVPTCRRSDRHAPSTSRSAAAHDDERLAYRKRRAAVRGRDVLRAADRRGRLSITCGSAVCGCLCCVELIAPHRRTRKQRTQDGRPLRRYRRRWKVERLFAWLQNFRRDRRALRVSRGELSRHATPCLQPHSLAGADGPPLNCREWRPHKRYPANRT